MTLLSIGEVARRTGLRPSTIRYYEDQGVLPTPARVSGRRRYRMEVVRTIAILRFAQQAGFTLREIKILLGGVGPGTGLSARWRALAGSKLQELDALGRRVTQMRRAIEAGRRCGCARIEDCTLPSTATASPRDGSSRPVHRSIGRW